MNKENKLVLRTCVKNLFAQQPQITTNQVYHEVKKLGFKKATIYNTIKRMRSGGSLSDKPRCGRPSPFSEQLKAKIRRFASDKLGRGIRKIAKKFEMSPSTVYRILKRETIIYRRRKRAPKYTEKQLAEIPSKARRLYRYDLRPNRVIILDDEKYFTFHNDSDPQNVGFWSKNHSAAPNHVKYKKIKKFPEKVLVWVAISERGISDAYVIRRSSVSIDQNKYLHECVMKRLRKFIREKHSDNNYIFWPDLASSHYAKSVTRWMHANHINFVPKKNNPPNCPQARPIETFWSILSSRVYQGGWEAKSLNQLIRRIFWALRTIDICLVESLMKKVRSQVRALYELGPLNDILLDN